MKKTTLLVVDDDAAIRFGICDFFAGHGYHWIEAADCRQANEAVQRQEPDVALVDYRLPDGTALDLLARWKAAHLNIPLIILTGHGSIDLAVRAIKEGAENFVTKPIELDTLRVMIDRTLEHEKNRRVGQSSRSRERREVVNPFVGTSEAIRCLEKEAKKLVLAESPLLILGETGVGKGVLAAWLHHNGSRSDEPFVDINCAGLSRELLESELFGHEKGAFTGATQSKTGLLEVAHRGTVFLDEIGDLDLQVQPKLLKVLEDRRFRRLGETRDRRVDIRLIAATHQDLSKQARDGGFRSDLFFRLSTFPLTLPPLRQRKEDIPELAHSFIDRFSARRGKASLALSPAAEKALLAYSWPGNVRELRNVLERAVLLCEGGLLEEDDLRFNHILEPTPASDGELTLEELEANHIERTLKAERGHVMRAAERLSIPRSTLYQKIKKYGISLSRF